MEEVRLACVHQNGLHHADKCTSAATGVIQACNAVGTAEGLCVNATAAGDACTASEGKGFGTAEGL